MENRLALSLSSVELEPELAIGVIISNLANEREQALQHLWSIELRYIWGVLPRDYQDMYLGLWVDVSKRNSKLVFSE